MTQALFQRYMKLTWKVYKNYQVDRNPSITMWLPLTDLQIRVCNWKLAFLFLNQNICCGWSKEPSQWDGSFEHPKHMLKWMDKKLSTILFTDRLLIWTYGSYSTGAWFVDPVPCVRWDSRFLTLHTQSGLKCHSECNQIIHSSQSWVNIIRFSANADEISSRLNI